MPPKPPIRGPWPFEAQAPDVCAGMLGAASAAVLVVSKVAAPSAATVKAALKPRRLSFQAIRVGPPIRAGRRAAGGSPDQGARLDIPCRAWLMVSRSLVDLVMGVLRCWPSFRQAPNEPWQVTVRSGACAIRRMRCPAGAVGCRGLVAADGRGFPD